MIIHRFMGQREYELLTAGRELYNNTDHWRTRRCHTNSRGFCFFLEDPDEAVHWLSGIVDLDWCVTMEVPDGWGIQSWGDYLDEEKTDLSRPMDLKDALTNVHHKRRTEICRKRYSTKQVRIISATQKYKNMYPPRHEAQLFLQAFMAGMKI